MIKIDSTNNTILNSNINTFSISNQINQNSNPNSENQIAINPNIIPNRNKILLIKHLLSFENLKYLKNLKIEIKEIIEKNKSEGSVNDTKLYECLKPNIFNEVFDNILIKHLQNFYKTINTNPSFTSRIENILLYYYKTKNKITYNSLIDLENNFFSGMTQHKVSNSMNDMKMTPEDKSSILSSYQTEAKK